MVLPHREITGFDLTVGGRSQSVKGEMEDIRRNRFGSS
jgi:hypothetical protein